MPLIEIPHENFLRTPLSFEGLWRVLNTSWHLGYAISR